MIARDVEFDGNVDMYNDGGAVELRNATVSGNANLTTEGWQPVNHEKFNHYVHISGNTDIAGDLNIESAQNIHIGNYEVTNNPYTPGNVNHWEGNLLPGKLTVGGDIKAEVTEGGHIMTTIDTTAKNIDTAEPEEIKSIITKLEEKAKGTYLESYVEELVGMTVVEPVPTDEPYIIE